MLDSVDKCEKSGGDTLTVDVSDQVCEAEKDEDGHALNLKGGKIISSFLENYFLSSRESFLFQVVIIDTYHRPLFVTLVKAEIIAHTLKETITNRWEQEEREGNKKSLRCNYFPVAARHIMVQFCHFAINYPPSPLQSRGVISRKYWLIQISNGTTYIFLFFCCWYLTLDNNLANSVLTMLMTTCEGACKSGRMLIDRKNLPWARL